MWGNKWELKVSMDQYPGSSNEGSCECWLTQYFESQYGSFKLFVEQKIEILVVVINFLGKLS